MLPVVCHAPDRAVNVRPNVFSEILTPSPDKRCDKALQLEVHCRTNKDCQRYTVLLNNMRILGIFDWLLAVKDFLALSPDDPFKSGECHAKTAPYGF